MSWALQQSLPDREYPDKAVKERYQVLRKLALILGGIYIFEMFALFAVGGPALLTYFFSLFFSVSLPLPTHSQLSTACPSNVRRRHLLPCYFVYYHQSDLMLTVLCEFIPIIDLPALP
jgi:hypothetical protein